MKSIYFAKQNLHVVLNSDNVYDVAAIANVISKLDLSGLRAGDPAVLRHRLASRAVDSMNSHWCTQNNISDNVIVPEAYYFRDSALKLTGTRRNNYFRSISGETQSYWEARLAGCIEFNPGDVKVGYIYRPLRNKPVIFDTSHVTANAHILTMMHQLRTEGTTTFTGSMGSCHCGDTWVTVTVLPTGLLWIKTRGSEAWQCYEGPAAMCDVPYGVGEKAVTLHEIWVGPVGPVTIPKPPVSRPNLV